MFPKPSPHPMTTRFKTKVQDVFKQYGYKDPQKRPRSNETNDDENDHKYKQRRISNNNDDHMMDIDDCQAF
jgi:hypothetical protein